jgi:hypothetical protein
MVIYGTVFEVISGYAPQIGCTQEKDSFIEDPEAMVRSVPQAVKVVIGADVNGHV